MAIDPFEEPSSREAAKEFSGKTSSARTSFDKFTENYEEAQKQAYAELSDIMSGDEPLSTKTDSLKDLVDQLSTQKDAFVKLAKTIYPDFTYDDTKSPRENLENEQNKGFFDKLGDRLTKVFGKDLAKAAQKVDADNERETDTDKREKGKTLSDFLKSAGIAGASILAALFASAKAQSGCYQYKPGSGQTSNKLDCGSNKMNSDNCSCVEAFGDLQKLCPVITNDQTCPTYQYSYKSVSIFDVINTVIEAAGKDTNDFAKTIQNIISFASKYGLYIVVGIALLIGLMFLIPFIKSLSSS
jgi:hypothetical protein